MRARLTFTAGLALALALPCAALAQKTGGRGGDGGNITCTNCVIYGDMIAGNAGRGGDVVGRPRTGRGSSDRQTGVGSGSKCISYDGRQYCD